MYTTTSPQGALHDVMPYSPPYGAKAPPGGVEDNLTPTGLRKVGVLRTLSADLPSEGVLKI